jgi:hypothetical protein
MLLFLFVNECTNERVPVSDENLGFRLLCGWLCGYVTFMSGG